MSPQRESKIKRNKVLRFFFPIILVGLLSFFSNRVKTQSLPDTVNVEDILKEIATQHDIPFWKLAFDADKNAPTTTDSVEQSLNIPLLKDLPNRLIRESKEKCTKSAPENNQDRLTLKKFRGEFKKVANEKNGKEFGNQEAEERMAK